MRLLNLLYLTEANLGRAVLVGTVLRECDLKDANLRHALIYHSDLMPAYPTNTTEEAITLIESLGPWGVLDVVEDDKRIVYVDRKGRSL